MNTPPILIVDDEPDLRDLVRAALVSEGYAVVEATTGREGVQAWEQHTPQLIILDILMPEMDGLQAPAHIRAHGDTPVMMLTRKTEEDDKVQAFDLGADDYVNKPFSSRELTRRVKALLRRTRAPAAPEPTEFVAGDLRVDRVQHRAQIGERSVALSRTECAVLVHLIRQPGQIFSREQLLTAIWGPEYRDDMSVLRSTVYRLRQKLEDDASQPRYLHGLRDIGYWFTLPAEAQA